MTTVRHARVGRKNTDAGRWTATAPRSGENATRPGRRCADTCISPPEHCRPCATRGRFPILSSAGGYFSIPKRGYAKHSAKITGLPKARSNPARAGRNRTGAPRTKCPRRPGFAYCSVRRQMIIILLLPCFNDKIYIHLTYDIQPHRDDTADYRNGFFRCVEFRGYEKRPGIMVI